MAKHIILLLPFLGFLTAGCEGPEPEGKRARSSAASTQKDAGKVKVGTNVTLEVRGKARRVLIQASVCKREGPLEMLLTRVDKKTHEAVLAANVDARKIHEALLLAGAKPGHPVQLAPAYVPPKGQRIRILLEYEEAGKKKVVPGGNWVRYEKSGYVLNGDWVFAGSSEVEDRAEPGRMIYLANEGDVICVSNFETALLDLPFRSSKDNDDRSFVANTEAIPPVDTPVTVILEPVAP